MYAGVGIKVIKSDKTKHEKKLSYHSLNKKMQKIKAQIDRNSKSNFFE